MGDVLIPACCCAHKHFHYRTNTTHHSTPYGKYRISVQVCARLTVPRGSPHGRCARWQWSTAGSVWWMCWLWVVLSSSADILDTSRENHSRETDTVTIIYLYLCVPPALHYTRSVGKSSGHAGNEQVRSDSRSLTSKLYLSSFSSLEMVTTHSIHICGV